MGFRVRRNERPPAALIPSVDAGRANILHATGEAAIMSATAARRPDAPADRPVYLGMEWLRSKSSESAWRAHSDVTPVTYLVEEVDDGQWVSRQGFSNSPGRPNIEIGRFASMIIAMTACERHDFRFWASTAERAGLDPVFMGSPDRVSDFVDALPAHEKDDVLDMIAGGYALSDGRNFAEAASYFEARKAGLKQERSGDFTATFTIHAADVPLWLMQAPPGTRLVAAVADLGQEAEDDWPERAAQALRRSFALVQDNSFHAWISQKYDHWGLVAAALQQTSEEVEEAVSETLRRLIGCPSRRDLATNRDAVLRLEKIDREFYLDLSRGMFAVHSG